MTLGVSLSLSNELDLNIVAGVSFQFAATYMGDLTGADIHLLTLDDNALDLSTDNGAVTLTVTTVNGSPQSAIVVILTGTASAALVPFSKQPYIFKAILGSNVIELAGGTINISEN